MYEALNRPIPNLSGYLKRIGLSGAPSADLAGLNALIWAHQTHIPFEDLNTSWLHLPVSLEIPALYDKVVVRRRGGYCYELNALFTRLLLDLGFDARSVFCRVVRGRDFLPPCAHRAVVVALEGKLYFCDVGFGGPMPAGALEIADGVGQDVRGEYFCIDRFDDYWWMVSRNASAGVREAVLQFNTFPQTPQEFIAANMKSAMDPDSIFVKQILVNLRTTDGSLSITDDVFTFRRGREIRTEHIGDDQKLRGILEEYFGIEGLSEA
jgi:N-hydroxyarylamine O-acetyltransferase